MKERLTEKDYCGYDIANRKDFNGYDNEDDCEGIFACLQKLGQLEDIEEECNIDIIKSIELCKKVNKQKFVYTKESWGIDTIKLHDDLDVELFHHRLYSNSRGIYVTLDINEYGQYWALTKNMLDDEVA